ncbi:MAG: D-alanyl-D-alanine carboxypeptidase family protein, partial [Aeromonadaceae bacterium]
MQQAARADGLDLALASSYRSFARQQLIWDEKFQGRRPVLDAQSQPLDIRTWGDLARIQAILRWSALPGT